MVTSDGDGNDGTPVGWGIPVGWVVVCRDVGWSLVGLLELLEDCRDGELQRVGSHGPFNLSHLFHFLGLDGLEPSTLLERDAPSSPRSLDGATKDANGDESKAHDPGNEEDGLLAISWPVWLTHFDDSWIVWNGLQRMVSTTRCFCPQCLLW